MKRKLFKFVKIISALYFIFCGALYFFQEKLIFFPEALEQNYNFVFKQKFNEQYFKMPDGKTLNGLLFKAKNTKGLIFYLHGNAGSVRNWGNVAKTYTHLNYDIFILDYRGYGKSTGEVTGQAQLFEDNQRVYDQLKKEYKEKDIVILGYSIGSGMAAKLASVNRPGQLILQAPYYTLKDLVKDKIPIIPSLILKYKFDTAEYLKSCEMPITLFHGIQDQVIPYDSSLRLKEDFKNMLTLIPLDGQRHNGITDHHEYLRHLKTILTRFN